MSMAIDTLKFFINQFIQNFDYADAILSEIPFVIIPEDDIIEAKT